MQRAFVASLAEGCQVIGHDLTYLYVNDALRDLRGRSVTDCFPGLEHTALFAVLSRSLRERTPERFESELAGPEQASRWLELHFVPVPDGVCVLSLDVTEQKRMADQLARMRDQAQTSLQMEAVGRVAGGIAHDINNVLSVILSYSEFIRDELTPEAPVRADVDEIRIAGMRAADLTRQLLAFGTQPLAVACAVDLGALVGASEKSLKRILGGGIELVRLSSTRCWSVRADPGQLEHVLLRLAMHARQAMPTGGTLTLETRNVELAGGPHVSLTFTTSSAAMAPDSSHQVLEPVHEIVKRAGGVVTHELVPTDGMTVRICLPRAPDSAHHHPATVPPFSTNVGGTILLVEEDPQLNALVTAILRRAGYYVLSTSNAGEALLVCEQELGPIDLLLTSVVLSRMNGKRLAMRLGLLHPELKVLYMAGYTDDAALVQEVRASGVPVLEKPITPAALLRQVRRSLVPQASSTTTICDFAT